MTTRAAYRLQLSLFSSDVAAATPARDWVRVDARGPGRREKCGARWAHPSGFRLEHCGHPTALYPWQLFSPAGEMILSGARGGRPDCGRCWSSLAEPQNYVRALLARGPVKVCPDIAELVDDVDGADCLTLEAHRAKSHADAAWGRGELTPAQAAAPVRTIVVVGCGKSKRASSSPAAELYTGSLFRAARAWAEANGDGWWIASARYGLVEPARELAPYNQRLAKKDARMWGLSAASSLVGRMVGGARYRVVILAGEDYAGPLAAALEGAPHCVEIVRPLEGLGLGKRLGWFKAARAAVAA